MAQTQSEAGEVRLSPSIQTPSQPLAPAPRRGPSRAHLTALGFMAPAGVLVILFFIIPVFLIAFLSMTDLSHANFTTDLTQMNFVGLANFQRLLADQFVGKIFFNTVFYVLFTLALFNVGLALTISLLTAHIHRRAGFSSARCGFCRALRRSSSTS